MLIILIRYGHVVSFHKLKEIIPLYPVMAFRKPESREAFFFNPAQYRYRAYSTMLGNEAGSDIPGAPVQVSCLQASLLFSLLRVFAFLDNL
jgi:hypothetical protein